jgi:hypothetical protein
MILMNSVSLWYLISWVCQFTGVKVCVAASVPREISWNAHSAMETAAWFHFSVQGSFLCTGHNVNGI